MDEVVRGSAAVPVVVAREPLAHAQVDDLDAWTCGIPRVAHAEHRVKAAQLLGREATSLIVEDLDRPETRPGRHTHDAAAVIPRADGARHVRAVALAVAPRVGVVRGAVPATGDAQLGRREDARVDDRDVHLDPVIDAIDA